MKTILVTGAAGFIGSHVAERLLARGDTVIGLDNLNEYYPVSNKLRNLAVLQNYPSFTFIRGEIGDRSLLARVAAEHSFTHIAHIAARAGVRPSIQDPGLYEKVNIEGTLVLLELAKEIKAENFVLTSSSSVYGNSTKVPFREDDNATDRPISPYAATKKASELLGYTFHHLYKLNINVVRPFTVYGPRGRPDMAPWLFLQAALKGTVIRKFGDGTSCRDYTFIDDFASGFVNAIDRTFGYEIFNLGNSATVSLNEALAIISRVSGKELVIEQHPMQPGDVDMTNADISKARELLDYAPATSFEAGMAKFCSWFKEIELCARP